MAAEEGERERLLALLKSQHTFPGPYLFRVIVRPEDRDTIVVAVGAALETGSGSGRVVDVEEQPSRRGSYVSLRVRVEVPGAEEVLAVYDALRGIEGVFAVM